MGLNIFIGIIGAIALAAGVWCFCVDKGYFHKKKISCRVRPIGRLDKETSGIVLFAKNQVSAQRLQAQRESGILHKQYIAIVMGSFSDDTSASSNTAWHTVCFPIRKTADHPLRMEAITDFGSSFVPESADFVTPLAGMTTLLSAVTHYQVLYSSPDWSIVTLKLDTGRTHQIRVHMNYIGHPLPGDFLYNPDYSHISRQALHSHHLRFRHPITGEEVHFTAPVPEDMLL